MKILHLEDNHADAQLFGDFIRDEWPQCEVVGADARDTFLARLASEHYDLILSDYSIAGYDGSRALQSAHEISPDTPFIFLSGTIGEDRAVAAMRDGAADYVLKDRPKRLIPAIRRALAHAEQVRGRRASDAQLLHVQRIENIGMLAAGIAHDFNNVLAPIHMGIPMVREHITDPGIAAILSNMEASVRRGTGLVEQILGFAKGQDGRPQILNPGQVIRELMAVIRQTFPKYIEIVERVAEDLWPLEADQTQLHQLFLNLCVNARDAMPDGGMLGFVAGNRDVDQAAAAELPGLRPGRHVMFEVTDTGTGISPENISRIWVPFFTTKAVGHGTGLGLSTVRRIVDLHAGAITIRSAPGEGTTFTVYLPAASSKTDRD